MKCCTCERTGSVLNRTPRTLRILLTVVMLCFAAGSASATDEAEDLTGTVWDGWHALGPDSPATGQLTCFDGKLGSHFQLGAVLDGKRVVVYQGTYDGTNLELDELNSNGNPVPGGRFSLKLVDNNTRITGTVTQTDRFGNTIDAGVFELTRHSGGKTGSGSGNIGLGGCGPGILLAGGAALVIIAAIVLLLLFANKTRGVAKQTAPPPIDNKPTTLPEYALKGPLDLLPQPLGAPMEKHGPDLPAPGRGPTAAAINVVANPNWAITKNAVPALIPSSGPEIANYSDAAFSAGTSVDIRAADDAGSSAATFTAVTSFNAGTTAGVVAAAGADPTDAAADAAAASADTANAVAAGSVTDGAVTDGAIADAAVADMAAALADPNSHAFAAQASCVSALGAAQYAAKFASAADAAALAAFGAVNAHNPAAAVAAATAAASAAAAASAFAADAAKFAAAAAASASADSSSMAAGAAASAAAWAKAAAASAKAAAASAKLAASAAGVQAP
jgi:hypothetical protein